MSKRRVKRRKRRARVNIKPLILVGVIIAGVITVAMSVNLKGADKESPTEEIYITETPQAPQAENTEPVTETEQEVKLEHDLNYTYPYNTMSADWGAEVYEEGFRYYEIPQEYKDAGGCFPEIVQVYLWCECKEYGVDYYTVLALIERESGYHWDKVGDNGNSKGYMQIYEKSGIDPNGGVDGKCSVSYRGEENLWGNIWTWLDKVNILAKGQNEVFVHEIGATVADDTTTGYKSLGYHWSHSNGYQSAFGIDPEHPELLIPTEASGSDVFTGNFVWQNYTYNGFLIAGLGGGWDNGSYCGFDLSGSYASGIRYRYIGGRLLYVPQTKVA